MSDPNKRKFWWLWAAWGILFVIIEVYALITKEILVPTLSRTFWWVVDYQVRVLLREETWEHKEAVFTFKPFRIVFVVVAIWLPTHILGGECAFGLC